MYASREKGLEVYKILFDEPNALLLELTTEEKFSEIYKGWRLLL